jgi:hypothetical protein
VRAAPTAVREPKTVAAMPGRVTLRAVATADSRVHAYVCWGGQSLGCARGTTQASLRLTGEGSAEVSGSGTLIGDACGASPRLHVIGAYVGAQDATRRARSPYSAAGPTRGSRAGPCYLALADTDAATRGIVGPGTRTGIRKRVWGTSVAAPQAARACINGEAPPAAGSGPLSPETGTGFLP